MRVQWDGSVARDGSGGGHRRREAVRGHFSRGPIPGPRKRVEGAPGRHRARGPGHHRGPQGPRARVLLIAGKPGSGRSSLAEELARQVADRYDAGVFRARLSEPDGTPVPTERTARELLTALELPTPVAPLRTIFRTSCARPSPTAGRCSCSTTRPTPSRSTRCCRTPRTAWSSPSPAARSPASPTSVPAPWAASTPSPHWNSSPATPARSASPSTRSPPRASSRSAGPSPPR